MAIRILTGSGRMTGQLECTWGDDIIVRLDPPWRHLLAEHAQLGACEVEVIAAGDPEIEAVERKMVTEARQRARETR